MPQMKTLPTVSVIIPALNAAQTLPATLAAVRGHAAEIIVVDGGSSDDTIGIARIAGAEVLASERGRGPQLRAGAAAARAHWLLFLHADTELAAGWSEAAIVFMSDPASLGRAAVFSFALDDSSPQARRMERLVNWRSRVLGLPYGDQGLLLSRALYDKLDGFRPIPLMEDVDFVRRIGRERLAILGASAVTSAERYRRDGWWARPFRNTICITLYFLGVSPKLLEKIYR